MITRRSLFGMAAAGAALGAERRPNVLVIQPDQHRAQTMGCSGDEQAKTPNLDRLAANGVRFTNAASSSPVCSPFRGSMQTGLYCHTHGVVSNNIRLNPELTTFAEVFEDAGYATGYIGKWHLDGGVPKNVGGYIPEGPRRQGWQEWNGYEKSHEYFEVWKYNERQEKVRLKEYDWEPTWHTDMALDFSRRHQQANKPWLYYLAYGPPHLPQQCPEEYLDMFPANKIRLPPDLEGKFQGDKLKELRELWQMYYGQVTAVDREVERVVEGLRQQGQLDNTIILYTSDHGDRLGSHTGPDGKLRGKGAPYATAFRIPLIVHWPGHISARVTDTLVSSVDLAPTILDLAGLSIPRQMQGDSVAGWCTTGNGPRNSSVYLGLGTPKRGWRAVWDGHRIYSTGSHKVLYDYDRDPHEMSNLRDNQKVAEPLHKHLVELAEKTKDPALDQLRQVPTA
jgi:arylsulfatase A-like enzyme